ncbi:MAG: DUF4153 domain-containing protein [Bacteroidetes bacterium]|nr:DUF4153 domain-containing protein [Bacteroidota bacterium]
MALQFPSLSVVVTGVQNTIKRFPFVLASAIIASAVSMYMLELKGAEEYNHEYLWKIVMCCWLGLNLFLSISLIAEQGNHSTTQKYAAQFFGITILIVYYFILPEFGRISISDGTRYFLFSLGLHLLVSFSPFIARGWINGFWQFNKTLFLRFLLSAFYSAVLYLGIALAVFAIDQLFSVHIKGHRYAQLWFFIAGVFNTWLFLAGVPKNLEELENVTDYPKGLKMFTQFVLLPLVAIYLAILYAYGIKISIHWELPKGWVSWLVNAFSVFGILSLLLIWPLRNDEGNKWISTFSRWFYRALFPLLVLLGVAIGKRVLQYGITENRYFVLVVALWLTGIAAYFLLSKAKNIKVIPVTLFFIAFLSSFGPWGAFSISEKSQVNRLKKLLTEEKILVDGKIKKAANINSNKNQISSIVHYLAKHHRFDAIKPWFNENLDSIFAPITNYTYYTRRYNYRHDAEKILALMGVGDNYSGYNYNEGDDKGDIQRNAEPVHTLRDSKDTEKSAEIHTPDVNTVAMKRFNYYSDDIKKREAISVRGFDYSFNFSSAFYDSDDKYSYDETYSQIYFGKDSGFVRYSKDNKGYVFMMNGKEILQLDLKEQVKKISEYVMKHKEHQYVQYIPTTMITYEGQNDFVRVKIYFSSIQGEISKKETTVTQMGGVMLLRINSPTDSINQAATPKHQQ